MSYSARRRHRASAARLRWLRRRLPGWRVRVGGYAQPQTNQKAIWALVPGILGLVCCGSSPASGADPRQQAKKEIAAPAAARRPVRAWRRPGFVLGIIAIVLGVLC